MRRRLKAEAFNLRQPGRGPKPGSEDTSRQYELTRQVVSLPAPAGETLSDGCSPIRAAGRCYLARTSAIQSDERAVARLRQELRIDERPEQRFADAALETPQTLCLRRGQPKSGHFHKFPLDSLKHFIDTHKPSYQCTTTSIELSVAAKTEATRVPICHAENAARRAGRRFSQVPESEMVGANARLRAPFTGICLRAVAYGQHRQVV
jgi:hypothetical protein